jgi:hypothetical protein
MGKLVTQTNAQDFDMISRVFGYLTFGHGTGRQKNETNFFRFSLPTYLAVYRSSLASPSFSFYLHLCLLLLHGVLIS